MNKYKNLILESLNDTTFKQFVTLHNSFLDKIKSKAVGFVKLNDTFSSVTKKREWIRRYRVDCAESDTVSLTLMNVRDSETKNDYGKWNVKCYCSIKLGKADITGTFVSDFVAVLNKYKDDTSADLLGNIRTLLTQNNSRLNFGTDQYAVDQLYNALSASFRCKKDNGSMSVDLGRFKITLFDNNSHWEVQGEMAENDYGYINLTEKSASEFETCILKLAHETPDRVLKPLIEKYETVKPDFIKNE